jgi:hypothetical protein
MPTKLKDPIRIYRYKHDDEAVDGYGIIFINSKGAMSYYMSPFKAKRKAMEYRRYKCGPNAHLRGYHVVRMSQQVATTFKWEDTFTPAKMKLLNIVKK